ncbi:MAG: response regulator [Geobacteraceae bacterium]|nr:response regulator [Geobacteraceae bacterium]
MSIKILLADDSITIQKVVGIIFGGEEYSLTVVDNGKAAVEKAREINPDVLLIDALMPGMSGYEVCEAVRATPAISTKPILLLTGSFEPFDEDKAKSCGADDFLAKPFESQQIVNKVKELMEMGSSRSAAPAAVEPVPEPEAFVPPLVPEVAEETVADNDIWGAFTAPEEQAPVEETPQAIPALDEESDIFSVVEEPETQIAAPAEEAVPVEESTGSQWIPVEEETFEFEDESALQETETPAVEVPEPAVAVSEPTVEESMFGDTDFGAAASSQADFVEIASATTPEPVEEQVAAAPAIAPAVAAAPAALTEDQLREALAAASKDVIERIVWEVVPDLAEVLIKEAIRQIKEGR